jgi:hypothetical protein
MKTCSDCGAVNEDQMLNCSYCGGSLSNAPAPLQPPIQQQPLQPLQPPPPVMPQQAYQPPPYQQPYQQPYQPPYQQPYQQQQYYQPRKPSQVGAIMGEFKGTLAA